MSEPRANERPGRSEAGAPRPEPEEPALEPEESFEAPERGPSTEQLRITAVQAAVAAGLVPSTGRRPSEEEDEPPPAAPALPDWTDPPTGQIPRVLIDREHLDEDGQELERQMRGPTWREQASDWDEDADLGLSFLLEEDDDEQPSKIAGREDTATELEELYADLDAIAPPVAPPSAAAAPPAFARVDEPLVASAEPAPGSDPPATATAAPEPAAAPPPAAHGRNPLVATATGIGIGAVALACFFGGSASTLALVAVILTLAAGEAFATLRRAGRRPLTLLGLAAVPVAAVGAYLWGEQVLPDVLAACLIVATIATLARGPRAAPVRDLGATFFVLCWVGVPGVFAALLISPAHFPHRHGVAFLFAAVAVTVAHDVGSYAVGSRLGKHRLAARVSPNKTVEGLIGGTVAAFVVALAGTSFIHPISMLAAGLLALIVAVLAPLGDLAESLIKRDAGVKDMGRLLPAHGGIFDRVDALLFVLPAAYGLFTALALR